MNTAEDILMPVSLSSLIAGLIIDRRALSAAAGIEVTGIRTDSREVGKGDLFLACLGQHHDARDFIGAAVEAGAVAVLAEAGGQWQGVARVGAVPVIPLDNLAGNLSEIAGRYFGHPSHAMQVIGITGTNGKTSTSHFISQLLNGLGQSCGVMGTLGYGTPGLLAETRHTTPDPVFTQAALAQMKQSGMDSVAMEVSSIGLHQNRVKAVRFDTAVFTNLTRDHLDYHGSMENYAETKRRLFRAAGLRSAVVNLDDSYALSMLDAVPRGVEVLTYSLASQAASIHARNLVLHGQGFSATVCTPFGSGQIACPLFGAFNISNVLAAIATLVSLLARQGRTDIGSLLELASRLQPVNGRMEMIGDGRELTAIVDYAHTPEGLRSALTAVRDHFQGDIWCVFGCGGNRDKGKRPLMGEVAESLANHLVITDDNPRREDGAEIIQHILSGIEERGRVTVIPDRAQAIRHAIAGAAGGDVVLVAGKGHENYQDIAGQKTVFSDANQVRLALRQRNGGQVQGGHRS